MNKQKAGGIEWTMLPDGEGGFQPGYTWNPVAGCFHGCQWEMADGAVADCYAKGVAERLATKAYPDGFESHYWHSLRLREPFAVEKPSGIFIDSMSDLMGRWVPDEQIQRVLDVCESADWHTFFLLTKNAPRLRKFRFPRNVWVGVSSPPDWMWGKRLSRNQQERMLVTSLQILEHDTHAYTTWMSFEPLSWDMGSIIGQFHNAIHWAVIGAASNGPKKYQPAESDLVSLVGALDTMGTPIFMKRNLWGKEWAKVNWRREFPA